MIIYIYIYYLHYYYHYTTTSNGTTITTKSLFIFCSTINTCDIIPIFLNYILTCMHVEHIFYRQQFSFIGEKICYMYYAIPTSHQRTHGCGRYRIYNAIRMTHQKKRSAEGAGLQQFSHLATLQLWTKLAAAIKKRAENKC